MKKNKIPYWISLLCGSLLLHVLLFTVVTTQRISIAPGLLNPFHPYAVPVLKLQRLAALPAHTVSNKAIIHSDVMQKIMSPPKKEDVSLKTKEPTSTKSEVEKTNVQATKKSAVLENASQTTETGSSLPALYKMQILALARINYALRSTKQQRNITGTASLEFTFTDGKQYQIRTEMVSDDDSTSIIDSRGIFDAYGFSPIEFKYKAFHSATVATHFNREQKTLSFSKSENVLPLPEGIQDQSSIIWQIAAIAKADPEQLIGKPLLFKVATTSSIMNWATQVSWVDLPDTKQELQKHLYFKHTPLRGEFEPSLEVWYSPQVGGYPVKIRLTYFNRDSLELDMLKLDLLE